MSTDFVSPPTKEGETKNCPKCNKPIISRLKEYKDYPSKIQWQEEKETKAHYDKNGHCKWKEDKMEESNQDNSNTIPESPPVTDRYSKEKQTAAESTKTIPKLKSSLQGIVHCKTLLLLQIEEEVKGTFEGLDIPDKENGAKIGMFVKTIYDDLSTRKEPKIE